MPESDRKLYWGNVEVPYYPFYAYEEILATFGDKSETRIGLLPSFEQLSSYVSDKEVIKLKPPTDSDRQLVLFQYSREQANPDATTVLLRKKPQLQSICNAVLEKKRDWMASKQSKELLLDSSLISSLRSVPDLFVVLMEDEVFRQYWDSSIHSLEFIYLIDQLNILILKLDNS
jgi:hypothetical protein